MMNQNSTKIVKRGNGVYGIGAVLIFGVCVVLAGSASTNNISSVISIGLIMGTMIFILLGPAHFLAQFFVRHLLLAFWCPKPLTEIFALNAPVGSFLIFLCVQIALPQTSSQMRKDLQLHFKDPLPATLRVIAYERVRGLNEGYYKFAFKLDRSELDSFATNCGFQLLTNELEQEQRIQYSKATGQQLTQGALKLDAPFKLYEAKEEHGIAIIEKELVVDSDGDVIFVERFR